MKTHFLKTWPEYFDAVRRGIKDAEIRKDDRDFEIGDSVVLQEWCPQSESFTGQQHHMGDISYILKGGKFGLEADYVMLCFSETERIRTAAMFSYPSRL